MNSNWEDENDLFLEEHSLELSLVLILQAPMPEISAYETVPPADAHTLLSD